MAGILDELFKRSTGMKGLLNGDDFSGMNSDFQRPATIENPNYNPDLKSNLPDVLNTAKSETMPLNPSYQRKTSPLVDGTAFETNVIAQQDQNNQSQDGMIPPEKPNAITELSKNPGLFKNIFGIDVKQMSANWKDKGGFEALMANPAFTVGAALLKSGSQGKSIGAGAIDSLVTGGAISKQYADQIKARSKVLAPISEAQRAEVQSVLAESDIGESSIGQKIKAIFSGKNLSASHRRVLDDVYIEAEKMVKAEAGGGKGQNKRLERRHFEAAAKKLIREKKITITEGGFISSITGGRGAQSSAKGLAKGGPVAAGKDYVVGEEGPEMFVSETNGTIINNDDSKVVSMLLESNPQLKNVSKARAVKILKARFPDYF